MDLDQRVLDHLATQRVGVLAVEMPDGSPHAAAVHFAHSESPLLFFFETNRNYRKSEALLGKEAVRASLVVGADESNLKTFQCDGEARLLKEDEKALFQKVYLGKFPEKQEKLREADAVCFMFIPTWWRFTDWTTPEGKMILTS